MEWSTFRLVVIWLFSIRAGVCFVVPPVLNNTVDLLLNCNRAIGEWERHESHPHSTGSSACFIDNEDEPLCCDSAPPWLNIF